MALYKLPNDRASNMWRVRASRWFPQLKALTIHRWTLYSIHLCLSDPKESFGKALPKFKMTQDMTGLPWDGYTPLFIAYRFGPEPTDVMLTPDPRALPSVRELSNALMSRFAREVLRGNPKQLAARYKHMSRHSTVE